MASKRALQGVDPLALPVGLRIGSWRILGWGGRGANGSLYRVGLVGREEAGSFALKLAISPGDERFGREAWLLSRIQSPHVPRLLDHGVWEHPRGAFPYLVMEWIEGEPLYEWASRRNPTSRQVAGVLAQVARALEATHAVGGLHRDVKGENLLVRLADGRVFLTDFGAGDYRGAATLTSKLLPPGTPAYRSPEAWGFLGVFRRHPTVIYPASTCDDLFALGVTAYRLVTDAYPPSTHPGEYGAEVWREGGVGPRPPRVLNPQVSPELDAVILRLLSVSPDERFGGSARDAAEALARIAKNSGSLEEQPLFTRWRQPAIVRLAAEKDAAAKAEFEQAAAEAPSRVGAERTPAPGWSAELAVALVAVVFAGLAVALFHREPLMVQSPMGREARQGNVVAVGDHAMAVPVSSEAPTPAEDRRQAVGLALPERPLEGQRKPPCNKYGEVEVRGGCWYLLKGQPPCKEEGKEDGYAWKGACYTPSYPAQRQPTAEPP